MADISAITSLDGVTYSIKDSEAREHLVPTGGTTGQVLTKTASGYGWEDVEGGGNVDTVNRIQPDANKNVQVDVELTMAEYNALPSSKESDNINYWIKDSAIPQSIQADDVVYDNTTSGLTATDVQEAVDELNAGLTAYTDGVWTVRKYDDGTAECWSRTTISTNINQAWGSWYLNAENTVDFPSGLFVSLPVITISTGGNNNSIPFLTENTSKDTLAYRVVRPVSVTSANIQLHAHAIGRWK